MFIIKGLMKGDDDGDDIGTNANTSSSDSSSSSNANDSTDAIKYQLSADEIRERRLRNLTSSSSSAPPPLPTPSNLVPDKVEAPYKMTLTHSVPSTNENTNTSVSSSSGKANTPTKPSKLPTTAGTATATSTATAKATIVGASPSSRHAITINNLMEAIFQMTLKQESATPLIRYIGEERIERHITIDMISELICLRLSATNTLENNGSIGYLSGCYKRLCIKVKENVGNDKILEDLQQLKKEIVSFIASSLSVPEIFNENSMNSVKDLYTLICAESNGFVGLLKELTNEIEDMIPTVVTYVIDTCYDELDKLTQSTAGSRSVLSSNTNPSCIAGITSLCQADKRYAHELSNSTNFLVSQALAVAKPPRLHIPDAYIAQQPALIEMQGVAGAALEHRTILGRILRFYPYARDPAIIELFSEAHRQTRHVLDNNVKNIRLKQSVVVKNAVDLILGLLKTGNGSSKTNVMKWLLQSVTLTIESEKSQPSPLKAASEGFMCNLGEVFLEICKPIFVDDAKVKKIDWSFLTSDEGKLIYSQDTLMIDTAILPSDHAPASSLPNTSYTFVTQSYFYCLRALHLGIVQAINQYKNTIRGLSHYQGGLQTNEPRAVHYLVQKLTYDTVLLKPELIRNLLDMCVSVCTALVHMLIPAGVASASDNWRVTPDIVNPLELRLLASLPSSIILDVMSIILFIGRTEPAQLANVPLDSVLTLIVYFLRRPWSLVDYNIRAELALVLYQVFLPGNGRGRDKEMWSNSAFINGPHTQLLESHIDAQRYLGPALLLLYGDVERTGYYEKMTFRRSILIILHHLWSIPTHQHAFRGIATGSNDEFISFANGLMNETNNLVMSTMEKLSEIKRTQMLMANASDWNSLTEDERNQMMERYRGYEQEVKGTAGLCLETLNMLKYLTSDPVIRQPFLLEEILPRLVSMLLNVLVKLVGSKSLEIKVDNMESYKFDPKSMLRDVCLSILHFSDDVLFHTACANDGFYGDGTPLKKAINTVSKLSLITAAEMERMRLFCIEVEKVQLLNANIDELMDGAPDEFYDPLLLTIMRDPVLLPTSGMIVDRSTIAQHLLNDSIDPFNRKPLTIGMVIPDLALKQRIINWIEEKTDELKKNKMC